MAKKHYDFSDRHVGGAASSHANAPKTKKTKMKKHWKILIAFLVVCVIGAIALALYYASFSAKDSRPVYGDRCAGIQEIKTEDINDTVAKMKEKYSSYIKDIKIEINCKEVCIDIELKKSATIDKAKKIAKAAVKTLDETVGKEKAVNSDYSDLFGKYNGVNQYDVQIYMTSSAKGFPVYGTKHAGNDTFSYTTANIKDKSTYKKVTSSKKAG